MGVMQGGDSYSAERRTSLLDTASGNPYDAHVEGVSAEKLAGRSDGDNGEAYGSVLDAQPRKYSGNILWGVCSFILVVEMCERLAFYTFSSTLTLFFVKEFKESSHTASQYSSLFSALVYFTPLFGGYVADELINRYRTIVLFVLIYIAGLVCITIASYPGILNEPLFLFGLLALISLGAGGIKSNVVTLGGDQFRDNDPAEVRQRSQFFNYFYWAINFGALIANGYLNNLGFNPETFSGGTVSYNMGYFVTYAIPLGVMVVAFAIFLVGTPRYHVKPATDKALSNFLRVFWATTSRSGAKGAIVLCSIATFIAAAILTVVSYFIKNLDTAKYMNVASLVMIVCASVAFVAVCRETTWLKGVPASTFSVDALALNNVHDMLMLLPFFGILIVFWLCYIQMSTNFQLQGCQMENLINGIAFSPAFFTCFDTITILIFIPIIDTYVYPLIERKRDGRKLRALSKMWLGYVCVGIAMIVAGVLEIYRKDADIAGFGYVADCCKSCSFFASDPSEKCSKTLCPGLTPVSKVNPAIENWLTCEYNSACAGVGAFQPITTLSIWWQIIPYAFVGLGEIFTSISAYELFYNEVDESMRSVAQGVNLLTTSYGSFAAGGLTGALVDWIPDDLNTSKAHLDYVFFIIAGITFIALAGFLWLKPGYVYREDRYNPINGERFEGGRAPTGPDAEQGGSLNSLGSSGRLSKKKSSAYSHLSSMQSYASGALGTR